MISGLFFFNNNLKSNIVALIEFIIVRMVHKIGLKNTDDYVLLDSQVYEELSRDPKLREMNVLDNLRIHSSGCAVFQKAIRKDSGNGYRTITIYLHKLVAERYLSNSKTTKRNLVGSKNGNKLDCRKSNLEYRSRSVASRKRKSSSKLGYTGVYQENSRYRAVISVNRKSLHIGMFSTPEAAAIAYNKKSIELYGENGKLNVIPAHVSHDNEELDHSFSSQQPSSHGVVAKKME